MTHSKLKNIQRHSIAFNDIFWFNRNGLGFKSLGLPSCVTFKKNYRYSIFRDSTIANFSFDEHRATRQLFWTQVKHSEIIKTLRIIKSHVMFCRRYWYHISKQSFISMIWEISLNGSSEFVGARLFTN